MRLNLKNKLTPLDMKTPQKCGVSLCLKTKGVIMAEAKTIYCPKCGRKVGVYDGKSSINLVARCKHCRVQVVYNIKTQETQTKPLPKRNTSSGMAF